mmetsp:Transcript_10175/g.21417  ORF Transcript_10175/g.21417 Transcript_10175/m.21417 type:complete len:205 (+) Transcript_10175:349-963(+)
MHRAALGPGGTSLLGTRPPNAAASAAAATKAKAASATAAPHSAVHAAPATPRHRAPISAHRAGAEADPTSLPARAPRIRTNAAAQGRRRRRKGRAARAASLSSASIMVRTDLRPSWTRPRDRPLGMVRGARATTSPPRAEVRCVTSPRTETAAGSWTRYRNRTSPATQLGMRSPNCQSIMDPSRYCPNSFRSVSAVPDWWGEKK